MGLNKFLNVYNYVFINMSFHLFIFFFCFHDTFLMALL